MRIRILIDMNLSPDWVVVLERRGWEAVHWSTVGDPRAMDKAVIEWAATNGYVIFTHDLDFGAVLAHTHMRGPSVIQVRAHDVLPSKLEAVVCATIQQHEEDLVAGALLVIEPGASRVRILPL